jgi:hypothetical protein
VTSLKELSLRLRAMSGLKSDIVLGLSSRRQLKLNVIADNEPENGGL